MTGSGEDDTDTDGPVAPDEPGGAPGPDDGESIDPARAADEVSNDPTAAPDVDGRATDDGGERVSHQWGQESSEESDDEEWAFVIRDLVVTVLAVLLMGGYLFAISGVWPPMVAIESGSMEPNMEVNDMVFVMESGRFQPGNAIGDTGVVPAQVGEQADYEQFGRSGDVIIFEPGGNGAETPIIHRAMFWVEEGENWCEMADPAYLGRFEPSDANCEAPHAGFITKGDANPRYDQASFGESGQPVKPEWIVGTAELRFPRLGWFRLQL
jgi:signal peptidase